MVRRHPLYRLRRRPALGAGTHRDGRPGAFPCSRASPNSADEAASLWRAAEACPTQSIGHRETRRPPQPAFPYELTPGVQALGHNARSSFGAHSYLVERPDGNLMVDSPRYLRSLAERIDDLGGIAHVLLSHRDDVADADRWAERYGADVCGSMPPMRMQRPTPR